MSYKLYTDKINKFQCTVEIEGTSLSKSQARIILETDGETSYLYSGKLYDTGVCEFNLPKLKNILKEGDKGTLKMEVIADDVRFEPWLTEFVVVSDKKVNVVVKEQEETENSNEVVTEQVEPEKINENILDEEVSSKDAKSTKQEINYYRSLRKVGDTLRGAENKEQLKSAINLVNNFIKMYNIKPSSSEYEYFKNMIGLLKVKHGVNIKSTKDIKETSSVGNEFRNAAVSSGSPDLQKIKFENEIIGGKSDKLSVNDIAKKHKISVDDIIDEISMGIKIEMEHTNDKKMAREIAMDHISEFPKYYSDPKLGIKSIEKKQNDELEEATGAEGASGQFAGLFRSKPIKREIFKSNVPVSVGGLNKPVGKVHSFVKENEDKIIIKKKDIIEESTDGGSVGGVYVTPKIWAKDGKGNWRGRFKKTYPEGGKFVNIKEKCKKFPYCNQSPEAIEVSDVSHQKIDKMFGENYDSMIESVSKKTGKSVKEIESIINRYLKK